MSRVDAVGHAGFVTVEELERAAVVGEIAYGERGFDIFRQRRELSCEGFPNPANFGMNEGGFGDDGTVAAPAIRANVIYDFDLEEVGGHQGLVAGEAAPGVVFELFPGG